MRTSGELTQYNWIWDEASNQWAAIARPMAPPPPPGASEPRRPEPAPRRENAHAMPAPTANARLFHIPDEAAARLKALCYDQMTVIAGSIRKAGENGCDFVAESSSAAPMFMKDMPVRLNLLDPKSGTTMSVNAQVMQATRQNGQWNYRLGWGTCPELLLQAAA